MDEVNERVRAEWREATTSRERIKEILEETTEFTKAATIAERALVSEPTARKYLNELVEEAVGERTQRGQTTLFKRDEGRLVDRQIQALRTEHTRDELIDAIEAMKADIHAYRETHGVETPNELALDLEPGEEGWTTVGEWRATERNLALAQAALQVDEAHRLVDA